MSFKAIVRELTQEIRDGIGSISRRRGGEDGKSSVRYYRCGKSHITPDCSSSTSSSLTAFVMIQERHSHPNPFITINIQQGTSMSLLRLTAPTVIQGSLDAFLARFDEDGTNEHTASHFWISSEANADWL